MAQEISWGAVRHFPDGSLIRPVFRVTYEYIEIDGHRIETELGVPCSGDADGLFNWLDTETWSPPHEAEVLSLEKRLEIMRKFKEYFEYYGWTIKFCDMPSDYAPDD